MSLKLWNTDINWLFLWSTTINKAFLWAVEVFSTVSNWLLNNLVSYWKADTNGSFPDSQWSNNWAINWASFTASGKINWAYDFDWVNDSIIVSDAVNLRYWTGDFYFFFWIDTTATSTKVALSKWPSTTIADDYFAFITYADWTIWFRVVWATTIEPMSTVLINDWNFHLIIWQRSWTTASLYIDNVLAQSLWWANANLDNTEPITFWNFKSLNPALFYAWCFDEIWTWNKALSSDERTALWNGWAWLSFDDFTT